MHPDGSQTYRWAGTHPCTSWAAQSRLLQPVASCKPTAELALILCRKEQDFEQRTGSAHFRGYRSESITYYGQAPGPMLPQQMQPGMHAGFASLGLLVTVFLIGAYLAVAARLASIWKRTRCLSLSHVIQNYLHTALQRSPWHLLNL